MDPNCDWLSTSHKEKKNVNLDFLIVNLDFLIILLVFFIKKKGKC